MTIKLSVLAQYIIDLQHRYTVMWDAGEQSESPSDVFDALVTEQHRRNYDLWHEEDKAREPNADDAVIAQVKRNIDALNQQRNDMVTEIDIFLEESIFPAHNDSKQLPWNSETVGSIIDRLSIASLKLFHMHEQTERMDASKEHIENCKQKKFQLAIQRQDLAKSLQQLLNDIEAGNKQNKLYRQFKMYNDPSLNPKIYGKPSS